MVYPLVDSPQVRLEKAAILVVGTRCTMPFLSSDNVGHLCFHFEPAVSKPLRSVTDCLCMLKDP